MGLDLTLTIRGYLVEGGKDFHEFFREEKLASLWAASWTKRGITPVTITPLYAYPRPEEKPSLPEQYPTPTPCPPPPATYPPATYPPATSHKYED